MPVCSNIRSYMRQHERVADLFSLLAVVLLFGSIWVAIEFQSEIIAWARANIILHGSAAILALVLDVFLIILFLNIGSARFSDESDETCFRTFRGRRHGGPSIGTAFGNWLDHMEQVSKKHR
ncbi:MAG: cell division protein BolA [Candidatus Sedimenticola endophacoides]